MWMEPCRHEPGGSWHDRKQRQGECCQEVCSVFCSDVRSRGVTPAIRITTVVCRVPAKGQPRVRIIPRTTHRPVDLLDRDSLHESSECLQEKLVPGAGDEL